MNVEPNPPMTTEALAKVMNALPLDPTPWVVAGDRWRTEDLAWTEPEQFQPRPAYSQNREDYS